MFLNNNLQGIHGIGDEIDLPDLGFCARIVNPRNSRKRSISSKERSRAKKSSKVKHKKRNEIDKNKRYNHCKKNILCTKFYTSINSYFCSSNIVTYFILNHVYFLNIYAS